MADPTTHILILDDDADVAYAVQLLLRRQAGKVTILAHPRELARQLADGEAGLPDVVLLDFNFTRGRTDGTEGLQVLAQLQALPRPPAVIAMTAYAEVALAVEAMKRGACDFITKPWDNARLVAAVEGALARRRAAPVALPVHGAMDDPCAALMGASPAMRELRAFIASVGRRRPTSWCSVKMAWARSWWRAPSTRRRGARVASFWRSTWAACPKRRWKANCSAIARARLRMRAAIARDASRPPRAAPCCSMKLATWRWVRKPSC